MAVIRDVMPAFELFQPAHDADALSLLDRYGATRGSGGRARQLRLAEGSHQAPALVVDLGAIGRAEGHPRASMAASRSAR